MRLEFHPRALADLQEILEYVARDNVAAADRLEEDFWQACRRLAAYPHLGHRRPDMTSRPVRFWPVRGTYLIVYQPGQSSIKIMRIFHGARRPPSIGL